MYMCVYVCFMQQCSNCCNFCCYRHHHRCTALLVTEIIENVYSYRKTMPHCPLGIFRFCCYYCCCCFMLIVVWILIVAFNTNMTHILAH